MQPGPYDPARIGPYFEATNFAAEATIPATVRRVVLMPLHGGEVVPLETAVALEPVFTESLQKQNRFEIVPLSRTECRRRFQVDTLSSAGALPHDFLAMIKRDFAADAVMFVDLTVFRGYRPLKLGVRGKLATVDDVRLVWTYDMVFSADDDRVANSARRHQLGSNRSVPADMTHAALQSPSRFADYVASAMFSTLPPVNTSFAADSSPGRVSGR